MVQDGGSGCSNQALHGDPLQGFCRRVLANLTDQFEGFIRSTSP